MAVSLSMTTIGVPQHGHRCDFGPFRSGLLTGWSGFGTAEHGREVRRHLDHESSIVDHPRG